MPSETTPGNTRATATALAALARRSLVGAPAATLFVDGVATADATAVEPVVLGERSGRPVLLCAPDSRLAAAARSACPAVLSVPLPGCGGRAGSAVFAGALAVTTRAHRGPADATAVEIELQLASIHLEVADAAPQRVPLDAYPVSSSRDCDGTTADPVTALSEAADRLREHANSRHADRLRAFVVEQLELSPDAVAAASLGALDDTGARVDWVDEHGAHQLLLPFTSTPHDQRELADAVRAHLLR